MPSDDKESAVLIACTWNAVRSPMGAAILRQTEVSFEGHGKG